MVILEKVVVSGFEPFDGYSLNPSSEVAKILDSKFIGKYEVKGITLPLDYKKADGILKEFITKHRPRYVLCCGQANRAAITLENVGLNVINTEREDNYGYKPDSYQINPGSPVAYFSTIDVHEIATRLKKEGIPAGVSYHAGTYGCNWILFVILDWLALSNVQSKAAFIHLPPLPEQAIEKNDLSLATMPLGMQFDALKIIIESFG